MRTLFTAVFGALAALAVAAAEAREYRVGLLLPYSGVYAALGKEIEAGFRLGLEHFGEVLGEDTVTVLKEDTEVKPPVGLVKAKKLVLQDRVDVLAGLVSSGVLAAVRDFVDAAKVPLVVANAGNVHATGERCSRYIIRVSFSNAQVSRPMGRWMAESGVRTVVAMAPDYAAGHQDVEAMKAEFEKGGGRVVEIIYTPFRKTKDFAPYLTKAEASGADALFVFYAGGEAISFMKQYAAFGLRDRLPLYATGFLTSQLYRDAVGEAALGSVNSLHYVTTLDTPENRRFQRAFRERYGRIASEFAVQGYDAARLIVEALARSKGDREAFVEAAREIRFASPRGPWYIDPATNNIVQNIYIYEIVKDASGRLVEKILKVYEEERDPPAGCPLGG